jgi:hypothetical protein
MKNLLIITAVAIGAGYVLKYIDKYRNDAELEALMVH